MIIITHANVTLTFPFPDVLNKYIPKKKIKYRIITALVERRRIGETKLGMEKWIAEHARHSDLY